MPSLGHDIQGSAYWRSLDELAGTPEFRRFVEAEFPSVAPEFLSPTTRRRFLKIMGASLAMAGLTGCRWPREKIVPYVDRPENRTPGETVRYATAMEIGGVAQGLLVTSYDGRPIKIEGNPLHPINRGATDAFAQASILELYDPDRSQHVVHREGDQTTRRSWDDFAAFAKEHFGGLKQSGGKGLAVLSEASSSPSLARMKKAFQETYPQATWYEWEPISRDNEREGLKLAFGKPLRPHYHLDKADVIVSFDADILLSHPAALKHARDFAKGRTAENGRMNRLYVAETGYSITGAMADERKATTPGGLGSLLDGLNTVLSVPGDYTNKVADWIAHAGKDLRDHEGHGVLIAGPHHPPEVHAIVHALNAELGNVGHTVTYTLYSDAERPTHVDAISSLAEDMSSGKVRTLVMIGGNPAYDAPSDLDFAKRLTDVDVSIHLSSYEDEASRLSTWHVPRAHYLESWGDALAYDGTLCAVQPLIEPLYDGKTSIEVVGLLAHLELRRGYEIVRETMGPLLPGSDFEASWRKLLHDGVAVDPAVSPVYPDVIARSRLRDHRARSLLLEKVKSTIGLRPLILLPDNSVYDGRFANNGWLQELPDPMTKIAWDNAALVCPITAKDHGIETGDIVKIGMEGRLIEIPAYVMPGLLYSVIVPLGYGRNAAGQVGDGVGTNAYVLRTAGAMHVVHGFEIEKTGRKHTLATTQDHHAIDKVGMEGREKRLPQLIREADLEHYREHPDFAQHAVHLPVLKSLWTEHEYNGNKWGMAIDLTRCTGCSACVVACQAENNIPVVGKDEVHRGREMQWIRVDRYFKGKPEAPQVVHQPVACHHCENAPCEPVCPVAATVHSDEGLNDMVYNRCIGTRYCSNNCPYKVRRFNYFDNTKHLDASDLRKMLVNPEVTVRHRGVMEKCTYCVQRIQSAKIDIRNDLVRRAGETGGQVPDDDRLPVPDGMIRPACAQVCPTQAIVFGDLNDPDSQVRKLQDHHRAYKMLAELNVKPRTAYLAKLRNPAEGGHAHTGRDGSETH